MHIHSKNNQKFKLPRRFNTKILNSATKNCDSIIHLAASLGVKNTDDVIKNKMIKNDDNLFILKILRKFVKVNIGLRFRYYCSSL